MCQPIALVKNALCKLIYPVSRKPRSFTWLVQSEIVADLLLDSLQINDRFYDLR